MNKMAKKMVTRRELLDRWRGIEEEDDEDDAFSDPLKRRRFQQLKEQWFADAFNFLIYLPEGNHIWCGASELMGPLLETFYNYFQENEHHDSPLKLLWTRISKEMRCCTQCIYQHHQAQEMYDREYELNLIGPLLDVLRTLDEERITQHLKEMNMKITKKEYDPVQDNCEVVNVMFEVLTYPVLLEDQSLSTDFQTFIEAIDDSHELTLAGHQHYPGVYALLFLKSRRVRSIGFRLAGQMGKLRRSTDLDPLQPLLKKCIGLLETDVMPSATESSRPRVQLERTTVWLGIKALLGFLEPPAFEEGILDHYPIFLSIVLNHISDDSAEFSYAVNCLRLLFEMLGCKLWLRSTLSPSVMRNTLLGQCFHTRNEKSHKEIFDLFLPFLQSLEALHDGEHEKQRRHFIYFLLHQVTVSSNFSTLMRKKACQIAFLIVHRGYTMNPPSPPFEYAHMWGPPLVSSLKDPSLHSSLRQPAVDLIQTMIVSDASALVTSILKCQLLQSSGKDMSADFNSEEDDEEILFDHRFEENDVNCWDGFSMQSRITSRVYGGWMCIPMLWLDVLVEIDPLMLPLSFAKAVVWALSRFSMVEAENSTEVALSVRDCLTTCASEISHLFGWKVPSGYDDGGDGTELKNSIPISKMCMPLLRTFKRLTTMYIVRMEQGKLRKQWMWEPMMGDSLILLLVDPNDYARQAGRHILEQVSATRDLTSGLQFLCASPFSLSAIFLGLRHALKLVQFDCVLSKFQHLHHVFFVLCKLLREGNPYTKNMLINSAGVPDISKFSCQGGFLKPPEFDTSLDNVDRHSSVVNTVLWEKFSFLLSEIAWISIRKCLAQGKAFIDKRISQMTCIRLLEVLPVVFERLCGSSNIMLETIVDLKWLYDLIEWGKSPLAVVVRYWKQALVSLLGFIRVSFSHNAVSAINNVEKLISCDELAMDEIVQELGFLSVSLMDEGGFASKKSNLKSKLLLSTDLVQSNNCSLEDRKTVLLEKAKVHAPDSEVIVNEDKGNMIILSDDEKEPDIPDNQGIQSVVGSNWFMSDDESGGHDKSGIGDPLKKGDSRMNGFRSLTGVSHHEGASDVSDKTCQKSHSTRMDGRKGFAGNVKVTSFGDKKIDISTKLSANSLTVQDKSNFKNSCEQPVNLKSSSDKSLGIKSRDQERIDKVAETSDALIKNLVRDEEDDSWEFAFFKSAKAQQSLVSKPSASIPKRTVIQLDLPVKNRSGSLKPDVGMKRFKPPRLDDWYRPILELDFFATVGRASATDEDNRKATVLKEIPVSFQSPEEYIQIFQPLVLEEFKAQLLSSFQEMSSPEEICGSSLSVMSIERIDDFHIVRCVHDESGSSGSGSLSENDLILLTRQPLQSSSHDVHMIGKVDRREKDDKRKSCIVVIRLYLQNGSSRLNRARKFLAERSKWCISRLMNITPQLREFQALSSIKQIPLLPIILNPIKHPSGHHESKKEHLSKLPQPLQHVLKSSYNDSQLQAIGAAVGPFNFKKNFELSLIQGPPGTGKTRTILAIVSSFLAFPQDRDSKRSLHGNSNANIRPQISQSAAIARAWQEAALARQINNDAEKCIENCIRRRILICAQSNAAVDELVSRISSEGIYGSDGATYKPYLVRVGHPKTIHPNSLPCFIDTLVDRRLAEQRKDVSDEKNENSCDSLTVMRSTLENLVDRIRFYEAKRANLRDGSLDPVGLLVDGEGVQEDENKKYSYAELEAKLRTLYEKKKILYKDLATAQAREKKASEESKALRHKLRKAILKEAELVVTTLSGCGGDLYGVCSESISSHKFSSSAENTLFDAVVIDEAAQALEPATLIPLQLLKSFGTRCIMVGDPKQLPATVLSNTASKYLFQCSMFERLQRAGHPVIMLTQQYRMHPEICHFPSLHFYENKLLNGDQMSSKSAAFHETEGLGPYVFFDIMDGQELHGKSAGALSLYNESEADAAVEVLRFFKKRYPSEFSGRRIGVITPYKCQLSLLRSRFSSAFGSSIAADMEFNTVDGFQGREVDILILSTVRAAERRSETPRVNSSRIGFVADVRRMNVALTRAKLSLWILGNARTLRTDQNWAALLRDAQQRNLVLSVSRPYSSIFQSAFRRNTIPESHGKQHDEMVKTVGDHAVQKNLKDTQERGRNFVGSGAPVDFVTNKREWESSTSRDAIMGIKRKARDKYDYSLEKDLGSVVVKKESGRSSKGLKSVVREHPVNSDKNMARIRNQQINMRRGHDSKGKSHDDSERNFEPFKKLKVESSRQLKSVESRQCTINHGKNQQSSKTVRTSSEGSLEKANGDDGHKASNQVELPKDTIAKRKQQRDAVDALLSSALISSKKTESSLKSMPSRRKSTPTHATRMPKPRKGPTRSSSCGLDDQTQHP